MRIDTLTRMDNNRVAVTVVHDAAYRTLQLELRSHAAGGYVARLLHGTWSIRCVTEDSAILMACAQTLPATNAGSMAIPWLQAQHWRDAVTTTRTMAAVQEPAADPVEA
jgi:hypothetical protein